jgi:DNA polymerase III alpha subunit
MEEILSEVWKEDGGSAYTFKKSHAFAYALMVMVQAAMSIRCRTGFQGTT